MSLVSADAEARGDDACLQLQAEAFLRLVSGRLDADHTPSYEASGVSLDELRTMFAGF